MDTFLMLFIVPMQLVIKIDDLPYSPENKENNNNKIYTMELKKTQSDVCHVCVYALMIVAHAYEM